MRMFEDVKKSLKRVKDEQKEFEGNSTLRQVLRELDREEARYDLLCTMQYTYSLPREYIDKTIAYYRRKKPSTAAFYSYVQWQNEEEYIELFETKSEERIKKEAEKQRRVEKRLQEVKRDLSRVTLEEERLARSAYNIEDHSIDDTIQLIDIYERMGDHKEAATIAEKIGLTEEAIRINERRKWFTKAAEIAEREGMLERALEDFELDNKYVRAGEVAVRIANEKRAARKSILSCLFGNQEYSTEEKKYIERAVENFAKDDGWHDTALELAEQVYPLERLIELYDECKGPYETIDFAMRKQAFGSALKVCENHGFYEIALGIATKAGNKKKAALYKKIIALKEHGDDAYNLEKAIEKIDRRTDEETLQYVEGKLRTQARALGYSVPNNEETEREAQEKHKKRRESGYNIVERGITYATKRLCDIRDAFVAEGAFEAIKFACGVDTTGQLARKAAVAVLTATGLGSPYAMYQLYNASQVETAPSAYEITAEPQKYEVQQKYEAAKAMTTQATQTQKISRGCGQ